MSANESADVLFPPEVTLTTCSLQRQIVHGQHHHLTRRRHEDHHQDHHHKSPVWLQDEPHVCYLLPGESHPLKALLAIIRTVAADELEEVVSFEVAGLLAAELS